MSYGETDDNVVICGNCRNVILLEPPNYNRHRDSAASISSWSRGDSDNDGGGDGDDNNEERDNEESSSRNSGQDDHDSNESDGGDAKDREFWVEHHATMEDLVRSAETCPLCAALLRSYLSWVAESQDVRHDGVQGMHMLRFTESRIGPISEVTSDWVELLSHGIMAKLMITGDRGHGRHPSGGPFVLIKRDNLSTEFRLVDTTSLACQQPDIPYLALSHCWGTDNTLRCTTTRTSEAERRNHIPWDRLPKTYQDAILVTRKLGFRYIWIDSLCIIQDDLADWQQESSRMASVFKGASLTLAATGAKDGAGGLFLDSLKPPIQVAYREGDPPALIRCPAADTKRIHRSPLSLRAWTLQELVLSRRAVHFAHDQLYWQCRHLCLSEDGHIQSDCYATLRSGIFHHHLRFDNPRIALEHWWVWMMNYTTREITVDTDWLPATAGITTYFAQETGLTPLLGLWKENLLDDLSWTVSQYDDTSGLLDPPCRPKSSALANVPSWSWLRYQAPIYKISYGVQTSGYAAIHCTEVTWSSTPLASLITSTTLVLSGHLRRLTFRRSAPTYDTPHGEWILAGQEIKCVATYHPDDREDGQEPIEELCLALAAHVCLFSDSEGKGSEEIGTFLTVRQVSGAQEAGATPKFERIGVGHWDAAEGMLDPFAGTERSRLELV
ncbi:heterokaryon incompatibility protein-domain-containing protein [Lasiosphaeria hispida]|uniref:Heterokaryon incompatibility protein-domain-containing protein n=1 Tax=Lasiosphaeria hispida TaxID=260671 RepID=A0AAJ0MIX6_9PEZI|nr:heterokaryon incompatibility protein-domain-containing protein [Lasiosphaeria hispida]